MSAAREALIYASLLTETAEPFVSAVASLDETESEVAALRVELQAARDERDKALGTPGSASTRWVNAQRERDSLAAELQARTKERDEVQRKLDAGSLPRLERALRAEAALQAAQEALRDLDAACEGVTAWKNHAALRAFKESWERARAVLTGLDLDADIAEAERELAAGETKTLDEVMLDGPCPRCGSRDGMWCTCAERDNGESPADDPESGFDQGYRRQES